MNEYREKPIRLTDPETNEEYILEFNREVIRFAESREFDISELTKYPQKNIPMLWFLAFRKNHRNVARNQTDAMLEELGGLRPEELERLVRLYNQANDGLVISDDDESGEKRKNSRLTMAL